MLIVKSTCLNAVNGHSNVWQSQPKINEAAIGNLLTPAAIVLVATSINILAKGDLHVLGPIEKLLSSIIMMQYVYVFREYLSIIYYIYCNIVVSLSCNSS